MTLKDKVRQKKRICGTHVNLSDPIVTEILASLDYDFLWIDMEHTGMMPEQVYHHLLAAKACRTPVVVRVPVDDLTITKKVLEMDIDGIVFPMVQNAEHAKKLLSWTLYPPYGKRGCGPKGAVKYGLRNEGEYYNQGHLELCRFVQVELESAALDASNIAEIPYLDGCILGMHDLSGSINKLGEIFSDENIELVKKTIQSFKHKNKTIGVSTFSTEENVLNKYHDMGVNMISVGADYDYILMKGVEILNEIRKIQG